MSLLYLTQQGAKLQKNQNRLVLTLPESASVYIPVQEVEQVMVFGNVQLTTQALTTLLLRQVPVMFLSQTGSYRGHLWRDRHDHRAQAAQFARLQDPAFQLALAREIVIGKAWNSKQLLLKLNRRRNLATVDTAITRIDREIETVNHLNPSPDSLADIIPSILEQLRGYEGAIAAHYFPAFGQLILPPEFTLTERNRRPPRDPVNAMLSFGYTLLCNNVLSLLILEGLNPYLGNLHRSDRNETQLAFDLMEEWRSPIVDVLVVALLNQQIFKLHHFSAPRTNGGIYLNEQGRRRFLQAFERRIMTPVHHPDAREPVPYRRAIQLQIRRYKRSLLENIPYEAFRRIT